MYSRSACTKIAHYYDFITLSRQSRVYRRAYDDGLRPVIVTRHHVLSTWLDRHTLTGNTGVLCSLLRARRLLCADRVYNSRLEVTRSSVELGSDIVGLYGLSRRYQLLLVINPGPSTYLSPSCERKQWHKNNKARTHSNASAFPVRSATVNTFCRRHFRLPSFGGAKRLQVRRCTASGNHLILRCSSTDSCKVIHLF